MHTSFLTFGTILYFHIDTFLKSVCPFSCQSYGIRPVEGGHLPWGVSVDSVLYDYNPMANPPSKEPLQNLNFLADSVAAQYTTLTDEPIICETGGNCGFSLDMHHVTYPLLECPEKMKFRSLEDILTRVKLEKYVPPERSELPNCSTFPSGLGAGQQDKTNDSFFENVTRHPVHDFRFMHWNPAEAAAGEETFLTADDTLDRNK